MDDSSYRGWQRPGPRVPAGMEAEPGETLDYICGHFRIFQYQRGHRYSTDDVLTAWYATTCAPRVASALDLGSGIGSVATIIAWRLPGARLVTLEAQEISVTLARKSARYNGITERMDILVGDLRAAFPLPGQRFDLITGSPPYFPPGHATEAAHPQAVPARIEIRGTIADYARAASPLLASGGVFVFVFPAAEEKRVSEALNGNGLIMLRRRDVVFKEGLPPLIALFVCGRVSDFPAGRKAFVEQPLIIRDHAGSVTTEYAAIRMSFGFPPGDVAAEVASESDRE